MVAVERGGVAGDLHFDVINDGLLLESLLGVLKTATSLAARDGMAGQTVDGLRWRVNGANEPIRIAFLAESRDWPLITGRWSGYSVEVPWTTAQRILGEERLGTQSSLELLANTLEVKKPPRR